MKNDNEIVDWMTVKGNHIPIRKGQTREQAMLTFLSEAEDDDLFEDRTKGIEDRHGAKSGALNPDEEKDYPRAKKHAKMMYETYRNIKSDVPKIAQITGCSEKEIIEIKEYVFNNADFFPDYDQAQTWDRLRKGQPVEADFIFIKHELMELEYRKQGYSYEEAHEMTQKVYDYQKAIKEYKNNDIFRKNRG